MAFQVGDLVKLPRIGDDDLYVVAATLTRSCGGTIMKLYDKNGRLFPRDEDMYINEFHVEIISGVVYD